MEVRPNELSVAPSPMDVVTVSSSVAPDVPFITDTAAPAVPTEFAVSVSTPKLSTRMLSPDSETPAPIVVVSTVFTVAKASPTPTATPPSDPPFMLDEAPAAFVAETASAPVAAITAEVPIVAVLVGVAFAVTVPPEPARTPPEAGVADEATFAVPLARKLTVPPLTRLRSPLPTLTVGAAVTRETTTPTASSPTEAPSTEMLLSASVLAATETAPVASTTASEPIEAEVAPAIVTSATPAAPASWPPARGDREWQV